MGLLAQKRPVIFAGENHMITLFAPQSDRAIAAVSCWRCTYSEQGEGYVLFVWSDPLASPLYDLTPSAMYSDNPAMARLVATRFNRYFEGFGEHGFDEMTPQPARFFQHGDGRRLHRIACSVGAATVELVWEDLFDAALETFYNTSGPIPYDVSAVICPCVRATITVNGAPVYGEIRVPSGPSASSAFLAFSETWVQAS